MAFLAHEMQFQTVCPDPGLLRELTAGSAIQTPPKVRQVMGELVFPAPSDQRPYLYGCMVLSFDGKMGFPDDPEGTLISKENRYDPVGGKTDFWIMNVCRTYADAVILGTGTLKARSNKVWYAEISDPDLVAERRGLGKTTDAPLNIVASIDGRDVPLEHPTFSMAQKPIIMTSQAGARYLQAHMPQPVAVVTEPCDLTARPSVIQILSAGEDAPDTAALLHLLRQCGVEYVSVEAPGYIWQLIREGLLDEYMLNYSGVMAGGNTALGTWGEQSVASHPHSALLSVGWHRGFLYTRQKLIYHQ